MKRRSLFLTLALTSSVVFSPLSHAADLPGGIQLPAGIDPSKISQLAQSFGVNLPSGALPSGSTPPAGATTTTLAPGPTTTSGPVTVTADQISSLPPDQQAAMKAALEKAMANQPATQEQPTPAIPAALAGISADLLSHLTPEQQKMLDEAKKTGNIPTALQSVINNLDSIPADVYAQLSPDKKAILDKLNASGMLNKTSISALLAAVDKDTIKSIASGGPISVSTLLKLRKAVSISCTNGKKTIKLTVATCPKGYKKV